MVKINVQYKNGEQDVVRISNKQAEEELKLFLSRYEDSSKREWVKKIKGIEDNAWSEEDYGC
tara:strand:- start:154 stop:339 length:186 start_codon:yes stop_codon:yes gene_type:complete